MPLDPPILAPAQDRHAGQFRAIVADHRVWSATLGHEQIQLPCHPHPGKRRISDQAEAFPGKVIHYAQDAEASAIGERIADKVQGPALVRA